MPRPFLQALFERIAEKLGIRIFFADEFGYAGYFQFRNDRRAFFKGTSFDLNPQGASKIAADKDYCAKILMSLGYKVPEGILVFSPEYRSKFEYTSRDIFARLGGVEAAIEFSRRHGFPLFVKPNEESEGLGVSRAYNVRQLVDDIQGLFSWCERVLIQRPIPGNDYRVIVLDGEVISAYRRSPFAVQGDGQARLRTLIDWKIAALRLSGRGKNVDVNDPRIAREVNEQRLRLDSVPLADQIVALLPNANLSTGGDAQDLTAKIHPSYREFCETVAADMELSLCGIDLLTEDITVQIGSPTILEINSAPGLNNFAATGIRENDAVEKLYERLIARLRDRNELPRTAGRSV